MVWRNTCPAHQAARSAAQIVENPRLHRFAACRLPDLDQLGVERGLGLAEALEGSLAAVRCEDEAFTPRPDQREQSVCQRQHEVAFAFALVAMLGDDPVVAVDLGPGHVAGHAQTLRR